MCTLSIFQKFCSTNLNTYSLGKQYFCTFQNRAVNSNAVVLIIVNIISVDIISHPELQVSTKLTCKSTHRSHQVCSEIKIAPSL